MTTQHKFTTDGKKVVIIGQLNSVETIVQEIFVTEKGDEIPSGEQFIAKSLHDEPVESWHTRNCRQLEDQLAQLKRKKELGEADIREKQEQLKRLKAMASAAIDNIQLLRDLSPEQAERLANNMSLSWQYGVRVGGVAVRTFDDIISYDGGHDKVMRSFVMYSSNKNATGICIGQYCDESGNRTSYDLFMTIDEALAKAHENAVNAWNSYGLPESGKNLYNANSLVSDMIKQGMEVPKEWLSAVISETEKINGAQYEKKKAEIEKYKSDDEAKLMTYRELLAEMQ